MTTADEIDAWQAGLAAHTPALTEAIRSVFGALAAGHPRVVGLSLWSDDSAQRFAPAACTMACLEATPIEARVVADDPTTSVDAWFPPWWDLQGSDDGPIEAVLAEARPVPHGGDPADAAVVVHHWVGATPLALRPWVDEHHPGSRVILGSDHRGVREVIWAPWVERLNPPAILDYFRQVRPAVVWDDEEGADADQREPTPEERAAWDSWLGALDARAEEAMRAALLALAEGVDEVTAVAVCSDDDASTLVPAAATRDVVDPGGVAEDAWLAWCPDEWDVHPESGSPLDEITALLGGREVDDDLHRAWVAHVWGWSVARLERLRGSGWLDRHLPGATATFWVTDADVDPDLTADRRRRLNPPPHG